MEPRKGQTRAGRELPQPARRGVALRAPARDLFDIPGEAPRRENVVVVQFYAGSAPGWWSIALRRVPDRHQAARRFSVISAASAVPPFSAAAKCPDPRCSRAVRSGDRAPTRLPVTCLPACRRFEPSAGLENHRDRQQENVSLGSGPPPSGSSSVIVGLTQMNWSMKPPTTPMRSWCPASSRWTQHSRRWRLPAPSQWQHIAASGGGDDRPRKRRSPPTNRKIDEALKKVRGPISDERTREPARGRPARAGRVRPASHRVIKLLARTRWKQARDLLMANQATMARLWDAFEAEHQGQYNADAWAGRPPRTPPTASPAPAACDGDCQRGHAGCGVAHRCADHPQPDAATGGEPGYAAQVVRRRLPKAT